MLNLLGLGVLVSVTALLAVVAVCVWTKRARRLVLIASTESHIAFRMVRTYQRLPWTLAQVQILNSANALVNVRVYWNCGFNVWLMHVHRIKTCAFMFLQCAVLHVRDCMFVVQVVCDFKCSKQGRHAELSWTLMCDERLLCRAIMTGATVACILIWDVPCQRLSACNGLTTQLLHNGQGQLFRCTWVNIALTHELVNDLAYFPVLYYVMRLLLVCTLNTCMCVVLE